MKQQTKKTFTLKTLTKGNVWEVNENDIFRMLEAGEKDADLKENMRKSTSPRSSKNTKQEDLR